MTEQASSEVSDAERARQQIEARKAAAKAKIQKRKEKEEKVLVQAKATGAQGVWLANEKRTVDLAGESKRNERQATYAEGPNPGETTTFEHTPATIKPDKRGLKLREIQLEDIAGGCGESRVAVTSLAVVPLGGDATKILVGLDSKLVIPCDMSSGRLKFHPELPKLSSSATFFKVSQSTGEVVCGLQDGSCAVLSFTARSTPLGAAPPPDGLPPTLAPEAQLEAPSGSADHPPAANAADTGFRLSCLWTQRSPESLRIRAKKSHETPAAKWSRGAKELSCRAFAVSADGSRIFVGSPLFQDSAIFSWARHCRRPAPPAAAPPRHPDQEDGGAEAGIDAGEAANDLPVSSEQACSVAYHGKDERGHDLFPICEDEQAVTEDLVAMRGHEDKVGVLLLSPDGGLLYSGAADKNIVVWSTSTFDSVKTLKGHTGGVCSLCLTPDGEMLFSGGADKCIRAWHTPSGTWLRSFVGAHTGFVTALELSADAQTLFSGCDGSLGGDSSIKAWRTGDGHLLDTCEGRQNKGITQLQLSTDGNILYAGAGDGSVCTYAITRDIRSNTKHGSMLQGFLK